MTDHDKQLELALIVCKALAAYRPWQDGARDRLSTIVEGAHSVLRMSEPAPPTGWDEHRDSPPPGWGDSTAEPAPAALPAPSFELFAAVVGAVPESDDE